MRFMVFRFFIVCVLFMGLTVGFTASLSAQENTPAPDRVAQTEALTQVDTPKNIADALNVDHPETLIQDSISAWRAFLIETAKNIETIVQEKTGLSHWRLILFSVSLIIALTAAKLIGMALYFFTRRIHNILFSEHHSLSTAIICPAEVAVFTLIVYFGLAPIAVTFGAAIFYVCTELLIIILGILLSWGLLRIINTATANLSEKWDPLLVTLVSRSVKVVIVVLVVLVVGAELGFDITALIAGASVAGLAVAFAAQDTIANVFGSLMVAADRPFNIGDYVKLDGVEGNVNAIGFRSTKLKTLEGHIITVPNKNCANSIITNVTERTYMRYVTQFGLVYQTTPAQMHRAVEIIRESIEASGGQQPENPPIIGFDSFGDFSLNIKLICWYYTLDASGAKMPVDFTAYSKWVNTLNFKILEAFNAEGLSFAYPTQLTYLANENKPLDVHRTNG